MTKDRRRAMASSKKKDNNGQKQWNGQNKQKFEKKNQNNGQNGGNGGKKERFVRLVAEQPSASGENATQNGEQVFRIAQS